MGVPGQFQTCTYWEESLNNLWTISEQFHQWYWICHFNLKRKFKYRSQPDFDFFLEHSLTSFADVAARPLMRSSNRICKNGKKKKHGRGSGEIIHSTQRLLLRIAIPHCFQSGNKAQRFILQIEWLHFNWIKEKSHYSRVHYKAVWFVWFRFLMKKSELVWL